MIKVKIIALGKLKESYLREACAEYEKRLKRYCDLEITELQPKPLPDNPSDNDVDSALKKEAELILQKIPSNAFIVPMCIEGKQISSPELSGVISNSAHIGKTSIVFIIGSSYGLCEKIKTLGDMRLSISKMTFPHQLARIMLLEQIYRAFKISEGSAYHK